RIRRHPRRGRCDPVRRPCDVLVVMLLSPEQLMKQELSRKAHGLHSVGLSAVARTAPDSGNAKMNSKEGPDRCHKSASNEPGFPFLCLICVQPGMIKQLLP